METESGAATDAEARFWAIVAMLDARLARPGAAIRIDYDAPPAPGDTVLIWDGEHVRAVVFDELTRPMHRVWIIGIARVAAGVVLLLDLFL